MKVWDAYIRTAKHFFTDMNFFRLFAAVLLFILFLILSYVFAKFTVKLLDRFENKSQTILGSQIIRAIELPARLLFKIFGLSVALSLLELSSSEKAFWDHIIRSLIVFSIFWALYRNSNIISKFLLKFTGNTGDESDDLLFTIISNSLKVIIFFLGSTIILQEWGYDIAGLLAGLGLGGLAFALAAKETASNLFGGIVIMIDRPFALGDWIYTSKVEGVVEEIGLRSTRIRTFEQALVTVPNSIMSNEPITNWSRMGKRRITCKLRLDFNTSAEQLKECISLLRQMLENHPGVHPETIYVYFDRFNEERIEILTYLFTKSTVWKEYLEVQEDINFKIFEILGRLNIQCK